MKRMFFLLAIALALFTGCNKDDGPMDGKSWLTFRLTDAPGDFEAVNVDIIGAEVIIEGERIELEVTEGVYNLLDFTNGQDTLIFEGPVPSGTISQVRLILGEENTLEIEGEAEGEILEYDLKTPSAQQSGLKLNVHADFTVGESYEYTIDFDAAKSVVQTGAGEYILKPVLRVFTKLVSGGIEGLISPAGTAVNIKALSSAPGSEEITTTADATTGKFMFNGLINGTYKLTFDIVDAAKTDVVLETVLVETGKITNVGTIVFN